MCVIFYHDLIVLIHCIAKRPFSASTSILTQTRTHGQEAIQLFQEEEVCALRTVLKSHNGNIDTAAMFLEAVQCVDTREEIRTLVLTAYEAELSCKAQGLEASVLNGVINMVLAMLDRVDEIRQWALKCPTREAYPPGHNPQYDPGSGAAYHTNQLGVALYPWPNLAASPCGKSEEASGQCRKLGNYDTLTHTPKPTAHGVFRYDAWCMG